MKVIISLATTAALAVCGYVPYASGASCDLLALAPIASSANANKCTKDSGLSFLPPTLPSADQVPKLCASAACKALLAELKKAAPSECTLAITVPPMALYAQLVTPMEKACEAPPALAPTVAPSTVPTSAPTTATPIASPTTAPGTGPSVAPTPPPGSEQPTNAPVSSAPPAPATPASQGSQC